MPRLFLKVHYRENVYSITFYRILPCRVSARQNHFAVSAAYCGCGLVTRRARSSFLQYVHQLVARPCNRGGSNPPLGRFFELNEVLMQREYLACCCSFFLMGCMIYLGDCRAKCTMFCNKSSGKYLIIQLKPKNTSACNI